MKSQQRFKLFCTLILGAVLFSACGGAHAGGAAVWIDVPLDGLTFPDVQAIKIEGHAASSGGISRVEIWINGTLLTTVNNPSMEGRLAAFHTEWTPSALGEYSIQAVAFAEDGTASEPDSARVTFGGISVTPVDGCPTPAGGGPTPVSCITPVVTDTPTLPPPAGAVIQFWADPAEIKAGTCTTIRWHVENVQKIVFGGVDQSFDGSYEDCLCEGQRYSLKVTHLDGSEEKRTVDINVSGSCVTAPPPVEEEPPPPAQDTTPPPAPSPNAPSNGQDLSCSSSQTLAWLPVTDDSAISGYFVKLEMEVKKGQWKSAGGYGPVTGEQVNVNVQCGGIYRWMVRAQDGAGNFSNWSGPSTFSITLN